MTSGDLSTVDWARVFAEAVEIVLRYTTYDVEDLVEDGMERLLAGEAPWDPSSEPSLAEHVVRVGLSVRRNRMRTERRRHNPKVVGTMTQMVEDARPPTPEEDAADAEERHRKRLLLQELLEDLADDPEAHSIVLLEIDGVHGALEQAEHAAADMETVRRARRRVARRVQALIERAEQDEAAS